MNRANNIASNYINPAFYSQNNEERFIWPLIPFLGGAAIGYIAGRPQYNYQQPVYYPVYYPYNYPIYYNYNTRPYINN